jgi:hypothetical protein
MKKSIIVFFFLLAAWGHLSSASEVVPLPDLLKPHQITVDDSQLYITENASVYVYSLDHFSLKKKFGRKGEGPQEFMIPPPGGVYVDVQTDNILVNSLQKLSIFTKDGNFIKEIKIVTAMGSGLYPAGDRYVGANLKEENKTFFVTINLFDANLNKGKTIYTFKHPMQVGKEIDPIAATNRNPFVTHGNKIFIAGKDNIIHVIANNGSKLYEIVFPYPKVSITEERKNRYIDFFKTSPRFKRAWERFKHLVKFPANFPTVRDLTAIDHKLYVLTYEEEQDNRKFYIFSFDGKLIKQTMLPLKDMNALSPYPYTVKKNKLYQVVENDDAEEWELHITGIL